MASQVYRQMIGGDERKGDKSQRAGETTSFWLLLGLLLIGWNDLTTAQQEIVSEGTFVARGEAAWRYPLTVFLSPKASVKGKETKHQIHYIQRSKTVAFLVVEALRRGDLISSRCWTLAS